MTSDTATSTAAEAKAAVGSAHDWMVDAWCARVPNLPWLTDTAQLPRWLVGQMAAICRACPVRIQCATYVDQADVTGGFWAGTDRAPADVWVDHPLPGLDEYGDECGGDAA